jgi:hypothetical protein
MDTGILAKISGKSTRKSRQIQNTKKRISGIKNHRREEVNTLVRAQIANSKRRIETALISDLEEGVKIC